MSPLAPTTVIFIGCTMIGSPTLGTRCDYKETTRTD
jgi:hypothetical protein